VIRDHVYHPAFGGSYSLKSVLPALVPEMTYAGMDVADGKVAGLVWESLIRGVGSEAERQRKRRSLLDYCGQDTLGLVAILWEGGQMPSHESSIRNLVKAVNSPNWHRPRPWRSKEEAKLVKRFVFQWFTCRDRNKPSGRDWACQLGISHTWLQKLVRQFETDPDEMWQLQVDSGDPTLAQLNEAKEYTDQLRKQGGLHPRRRRKRVDLDE